MPDDHEPTTLGLVADPHLIAPDDPHEEKRRQRRHFAAAWPSFRRMLRRLNEAGVDHVIVLGDLLDYYTDANRDFALELLDELDAPWHLTPGNHDFQVPADGGDPTATTRDREPATEGWRSADVTLESRALDVGDVRFLLVDSALSEVPPGTGAWLERQLSTDRYCVLCTHVPLDAPAVVDAITDVEPDRNLDKYVQRGSPDLFEEHLRGRVDAIFSGHLHFPLEIDVDGTRQHVVPTCVHAEGRTYDRQGTGTILHTDAPDEPRQFRTDPDAA